MSVNRSNSTSAKMDKFTIYGILRRKKEFEFADTTEKQRAHDMREVSEN